MLSAGDLDALGPAMGGRYVVMSSAPWREGSGFFLSAIVAGVLFIGLVYLTSDEIPLGVAILFALTWSFLLGGVGYATVRNQPRTRRRTLFLIDEAGIYIGTTATGRTVPWSRIIQIVLYSTDTVGSGTTHGVAVSVIRWRTGSPHRTAPGRSDTPRTSGTAGF
jgi:hypothetical protein